MLHQARSPATHFLIGVGYVPRFDDCDGHTAAVGHIETLVAGPGANDNRILGDSSPFALDANLRGESESISWGYGAIPPSDTRIGAFAPFTPTQGYRDGYPA